MSVSDQGEVTESQITETDKSDEDREMGEGEIIEENLEDGELEDGEIDDEPQDIPPNSDPNKFTINLGSINNKPDENIDQENKQEHHVRKESKNSNRDKKKRKRRRDKEDDNDTRKHGKKKRYVDHDRINEDGDVQWLGEKHHGGGGGGHKSIKRHRNRGDSRSPNQEVYNDSPYDSPPGLYDSPSDEDGERNGEPTSMLGLVQDEFMDVSIAAQERQHAGGDNDKREQHREKRSKKKNKQRPDGSRHRERERERGDRVDRGERVEREKKVPLNDLPRSERPQCKFFKEGKCQKGSSCQFNHDFQPEKKLDVCKYYLAGACNRDNCVFLHGEFPCRFYHTGKKCYAGDDCRFSHEPMTEEMEELFDKILNEDFHPKKPSLLGSPPRHVLEEAERLKERREQVKKIPSIFDIEVFPPGHSPTKSPQKNIPSSRPSGFYNDSHGSNNNFGPPMNNMGPGMNNMGPGMNNMGPPMNNMGGPGQMNQGQMNNMGPPMNNMGGQGQMNPGQMNNMGPPMNNMGGQGQMNPGQMNNMGPPMNNMGGPGQMGPRMPPPSFQGGQDMGANQNVAPGSVYNMIGAILRTAAPLLATHITGRSGQPGQSPNYPDSGAMYEQSQYEEEQEHMEDEQHNSGDFQHQNWQNPPHNVPPNMSHNVQQNMSHNVPPNMSHNSQQNMSHNSQQNMSHNSQQNMSHNAPPNMPHNVPKSMLQNFQQNTQNFPNPDNHERHEVMERMSSPPQNKPLDPRARMRQTARTDLKSPPQSYPGSMSKTSSDDEGHHSGVEDRRPSTDDEKPTPAPQPEMNFGPKFEFSKDDNWYSSDEDNDDQKLSINTEEKSTLNKKPTINIMEMISNVKDKSLHNTTDTRNPSSEPPAPTFYSPSMTSKSYSRPDQQVPVTHCILTNMIYRIKSFTLALDKPYDKIPKSIDPIDSRYQNDPRVQKYCARLARKTAMPTQTVTIEKKVDRIQLPDLKLNLDGTIKMDINKDVDSRMSRTSIEDLKPPGTDARGRSDPRMLRNISNEDQKPKFVDPRISRNVSVEENIPKPLDPRMSRKSSLEEQIKATITDPRMSRNLSMEAPKSQIIDPRMSRKTSTDEKSPIYQDPRMRRVQKNTSDSASNVKNTLGTDIESIVPKPRTDPRMARSISMETGVPNIQQFS